MRRLAPLVPIVIALSLPFVPPASGGRGAVREFCELVLRAQGQLGAPAAV